MNQNLSINGKHSFSHPVGILWLFVLIFLLMCPFGCKLNLFGKKNSTTSVDNAFTITIDASTFEDFKPFINPENLACMKAVMEKQAKTVRVVTKMEVIEGCLYPRLIRVTPIGKFDKAQLTNAFIEAGKLVIKGTEKGEVLTGNHLEEVTMIQRKINGSFLEEPAIKLEFKLEAVPLLRKMSEINLGKKLHIELDNQELISSQIQEVIKNRFLVLSLGLGTSQSAIQSTQDLYTLLKGAMFCSRADITITNLH